MGLLQTPSGQTLNRRQCFERRTANIRWVEELPREGLTYGVNERQLRLHETPRRERIYIQYPGTEASAADPRPWDFRPKIELRDGSYLKDLAFNDVWDLLIATIGRADRTSYGPAILATLFYRMAYMKDHVQRPEPWTSVVRQLRAVDGDDIRIQGERNVRMNPHWLYDPPDEVLRGIEKEMGDWGGISLEAFLQYNDLLAWNEDCKYYYRDVRTRGDKWLGKSTGRINTLLTHIRIIGLAKGEVKLSNLLGSLSRQGVAPVTKTDSLAICAPYLTGAD